MSKILVIEDDNIIDKFLNEIAEENVTIINTTKKSNELKHKDITLNKENYDVFKGKEKIFLTEKEFEILRLFMENPNKVFSRENILDSVWRYNYFGDAQIINTHIKNIRKKLGNDYIVTIRGAGYKL